MEKILIFGGTSEGRLLAEYCDTNNIAAIVCVATEYGTELLKEYKNIEISEGRKNEEEMRSFFIKNQVKKIYDATHPYAKLVSENISKVCDDLGLKYIRILRDSSEFDKELSDYYREFNNIEEVVDFLKDKEDNILIATGSKELAKYKDLNVSSLFPRVLPNKVGIEACEEIKIPSSNIIAMQGPFDIETNIALLNKYKCKYMVTKEAGDIGGFREKIEACKKVNAKALVIKRPTKEEGISLEEAKKLIEKDNKIVTKIKDIEAKQVDIKVLGLGMGSINTMSFECIQSIKEADYIIGAKRMVELCKTLNEKDAIVYDSYKATEILSWIYKNVLANKKIVLAMSGDTGFYSASIKLKKEFKKMQERGYFLGSSNFEILAGISSFSYMCAKYGIDYTDMKILSIHGRDENLNELFDSIKFNKKNFCT